MNDFFCPGMLSSKVNDNIHFILLGGNSDDGDGLQAYYGYTDLTSSGTRIT